MKQTIKKSLVSGLVFSLTVIIVGVTYAAVSTVSSGDPLTETLWNNLVGLANTNETNITNINSNLDGVTDSGTYKLKTNIGYAKQTLDLTVSNQVWTTIPGVTKPFNIGSAKTVKFRAYGSITPSGGTSNATHCGFRFVVDGVGYGNTTWGDQIIGCAKSTAGVGSWCPWTIERDFDLGAGSHSISIEMKDRKTDSPGCNNQV